MTPIEPDAAPSTAVVRTARRADRSAARQVMLAAYRQYAHLAPADVFPTYLADVLDLELHARRGTLLVAVVDRQVLAVVTFQPDATVQGLGWPEGWASGRGLAVRPGARGLGLARRLLAECENRARQACAPVFAFHTGNFMTGAQALYDQMGYRRLPAFDVDMGAHYGIDSVDRHLGLAYHRVLPSCGSGELPLAA